MKRARPASSFRLHSRSATRALGCLLLVATAPIASRAQTSDPSQQTVDHVNGVVVNAIDMKPIARALVVSGDQRLATMTDSQGRFSFDIRHASPNPSSNTFGSPAVRAGYSSQAIILMARRPGYLNMSQPVRISSNPQTPSQEIQLKLVPECILRGHLSLSNSTRPAGLQVQIRRKQVMDGLGTWVQAGAVQVNSRGDYSFADLPAGDYKVMTPAWSDGGFSGPISNGGVSTKDETFGYAPSYYGDTADLASSPVIHIAAGETVDANLNLHTSTLYHVMVPVSNMPKGNGFNVQVGSQDEMSGLNLGFNSQTQMAEGFLPNGAYDIRVSSFGQPQSSGIGRVEVAGKPVKAAPIALSPSGQIPVIVHQQYTATQSSDQGSGPTQPINQNSEVQIRSLPQGNTRRSVDISLQPLHPGTPGIPMRNTPNKGDDDLVLDNVQPGTYRVVARAFRGYVAAISSDGVDLMRQPLVVGSSGPGGPIEVTLRDDSATLSGSVSIPNSAGTQPDQDVAYAITCIPLDASFAVQVNPSFAFRGKFTLPNLPPGQYLVLASSLMANNLSSNASMTNLEWRNPDVLREYQSKGTVVTLSPGDKAEIQVPLYTDGGN